jgi:hypothetical protein
MRSFWSILVGLALLAAGGLPDSAEGSDRRGVTWKKTANFNNHQPRLAIVKSKKRKAKVEVAHSRPSVKKFEAPAKRVLATFELDDSALSLAPPEEPLALAKPTPGKCEWVRSIVAGYAFENVTPRSCAGSVFTFEARRGDRTFLVQASALNGELVKVERILEPAQGADAVDETTLAIEPASQ